MRTFLRINPSTVLKALLMVFVTVVCACNSQADNQTTKGNKLESKTAEKVSLKSNKKTILCFGNSLTEGYGLKPEEAYPALLQNRLDAEGFDYDVVNAGISGETTTGGKGRLSWTLVNGADIFILELGANDGLRGIPLTETELNLQNMIDTVKHKLPKAQIVLAGMQIPPNLGIDYTNEFKALYPRLAKKNEIALIPFLLEGVAGDPKLNQKDGIHPTSEGTKIVAENIWQVIQPMLLK